MAGEYTSCKPALFTPSLHPPSIDKDTKLTFQAIERKSKRGQPVNSYTDYETIMNHRCVISVVTRG